MEVKLGIAYFLEERCMYAYIMLISSVLDQACGVFRDGRSVKADVPPDGRHGGRNRSEEHTSELQSHLT